MRIKKYVKINTMFTILVVLAVAIMFLLNATMMILSNRYPLRLDLTANSAYEIGDETKTLLNNLTDDINIYVLSTKDSFNGSAYLIQARNIIDQYQKYSDHINLEYIDYEANPAFAAQYPDLTLTIGSILITRGERTKLITLSSLFNYTYDTSGNPVIESSRAEEALTSAIINVLSDTQISVAVLTGNGTTDLSAFVKVLQDNNYEVSYVNMVTESLDEYDICMLFAPTIDLSEDVLSKIDSFLYNDGKYGRILLYTADVTQPELPNLEGFLQEWGITVEDGSVFETTAERTYRYQPYYPIVDYTSSTYKDKLKDSNSPLLMPLSRPLKVLYEAKDLQYTEVLLSFFETAGLRPGDAGDNFKAQDANEWGPFPAMVLASRRIFDTYGMTKYSSHIIISASTHMFDSAFLYDSSLTNTEYFLNLLNDKLERTDTINIEPKSLSGKVLGITTSESNRLGVVLCVIVPLGILLSGVSIWLIRRYK